MAGYPALRLMTLAETGTRGLLGAALRSRADRDETALARRLLHLLGPGMLVLLDRAFDSNARASGTALVTAISARNPGKGPRPPVPSGSQASNEHGGFGERIADLQRSCRETLSADSGRRQCVSSARPRSSWSERQPRRRSRCLR